MEDFAAFLVDARKQARLTQTQLAAAAGLTASYLSFIENRKKPPPSDDVCRRLADALDLPAEALLERAHLERAPKELRARVQDLTSSLHREQSTVRTFLEGLLSPFLFSGPPGYADSAMDVLALSPARRRRIRESVKRTADADKRHAQEVRKLLADLSHAELRKLATRLPELLEGAPPHSPPLLTALPDPEAPEASRPFVLVLREEHLGSLSFPVPGDHVLIEPAAEARPGDLLLLRHGKQGVVRRLESEGALQRLEGGPDEAAMPVARMRERLAAELVGILVELRTPLGNRRG